MSNVGRLCVLALLLTPHVINAAPPRTAQDVRAILAREVDFPGIDDPKTTLRDALNLLTSRYGLPIAVNKAAFPFDDVLSMRIAEDRPISAWSHASVDRILREILLRVLVPREWPSPIGYSVLVDPTNGRPLIPGTITYGALFVVRSNGIEVTTADMLWAQRVRPEGYPALSSTQLKARNQIRGLLAREVDFPGIDDPKTTLGEVLPILQTRYGLKIRVNHDAFRFEMLNEVLLAEIASPPLPAQKDVQLDRVLRELLARIPIASGAVYVVDSYGIEVTTELWLRERSLQPEPQAAPSVRQLKRAIDLRDTLVRPTRFNGFDDPKMTLEEALASLEKRYGLRFEVNEKAFKFEQLAEPLKTDIALTPIPPSNDIMPGKVLEMLLARIPVQSGAVFVIRPHGYIEITTKKFLLAECLGIELLFPSLIM